MKRGGFIKSVLTLIVAPKVLAEVNPVVKSVGIWHQLQGSYKHTYSPLTQEMLNDYVSDVIRVSKRSLKPFNYVKMYEKR